MVDFRSISSACKGAADHDGYEERDLHVDVDDDFTGGHGFCACAEHWAQFFMHCNLHLAIEMIVFIVVLLDACVLSIEMYDVYHELPFEVALPQVALAVVVVLAVLVIIEIYFNIEHGYNMVGVLLTIELLLLFGSIFFVSNELAFVSNLHDYCEKKKAKGGDHHRRALASGCPKEEKEMSDGVHGGRRLASAVKGVYGFIDGFDPMTGELLIVIIGACRLVLVAYNLIYTFVLLATLPPIHKRHHDHHAVDHEEH